jgi:hypothetical protein
MSRLAYTYGKIFVFLTLLSLAAASFVGRSDAKISKAKLQELLSIGVEDLPGGHGVSEILSFDVSPNNQNIAVGFKISEQDRAASISVGTWEIVGKHLLAKTRLEESTEKNSAFIRLHFTPDGEFLIAQTNDAIYILDPNTLEIKRTIQVSSYWSELSGDGKVLNVTASADNKSSFYSYRVQSGELLGHWPKPKEFQYFGSPSVSFHGDQMLIITPGSASDILLVDSFTGTIARTFSSGYRQVPDSPSNGIGSAVFIDSSRFVVAPSNDSGRAGRYDNKTLKVFSTDSGGVLQELAYKHLAAGHEPWVSASGSTLALINAWRSPSQNVSDTDVGVPIQLLMFRLGTTQPVCVVEDLPISGNAPEGAADAVKPSRDLSLFGFRLNNQLRLYEIRHCHILATR